VNENICEMSYRERRRCASTTCRTTSRGVRRAGEGRRHPRGARPHVTAHLLHAKREEWREYITQVTQWELDRYLAKY
jgi:glutamine synthetase